MNLRSSGTARSALSLRQGRFAMERIPYARPDFELNGMKVVRNPDPVLKFVAFTDESLWRTMERSELELFEAKEQRVAKLLGDGSEVVVGKSRSSRAYEYRDFVIAVLKSMRGWNETLKKFCDPIYWGWRPFEVVWKPGLKYNGRSDFWGIEAVNEKLPEHFAHTVDRKLVYTGDLMMGGQLLDTPVDQFKWLVGTSGSVNNPYGEALYTKVYLYWFLKSKFLQMFSQGLERSIGMLKVKAVGGTAQAASQDDSINQLIADVEQVRDILSQHNILVEMADIRTEFITDVNVVEGWQKALEYCDDKIKRGVLSQNLTSRIDSKGSRAAAEVHYEILDVICRTDAPTVCSIPNDQLFPWILALNYGEVEPEDLPKLRLLSAMPVDMEASRTLYDMGATIDARALARRAHVPIVVDSEPADRDAIPLSKALAQEQALETAVAFGAAPGADSKLSPGPPATNDKKSRDQKKAREDRQRTLGEPTDPIPPAGSGAILSDYFDEMREAWLREAGVPFASHQRRDA